MRILYQFPISHFCEKSRWHLDAKGLAYEVKDLLPGAHRRLGKKLGVRGTVPMLQDGELVLGDSADIGLHLERTYPAVALLPEDPRRARVLELGRYFDDVGAATRRYLYAVLLRRRGAAARVMLSPYALPVRIAGRLAAPLIESSLRKMYLRGHTVESARAELVHAFDRLEQETRSDPTRYLLGDSLTLADIGAASLLAPLLAPAGTPWSGVEDEPEEITTFREEVAARAGGAWVLRRYRDDRRRAARMSRAD